MKLLITGGHLTPALAIIDYMRNNNAYKSTDFVFVGRKYAVESEQTISLEYK
ncbi:undecaprenyldiphospho-muramoylpentapeptide beta-N-acetylglucosaminyltransferase, partial [Candidatus Roizmanbacteria bacterium CG_4_10_14_0_8_um_filter_39_9]